MAHRRHHREHGQRLMASYWTLRWFIFISFCFVCLMPSNHVWLGSMDSSFNELEWSSTWFVRINETNWNVQIKLEMYGCSLSLEFGFQFVRRLVVCRTCASLFLLMRTIEVMAVSFETPASCCWWPITALVGDGDDGGSTDWPNDVRNWLLTFQITRPLLFLSLFLTLFFLQTKSGTMDPFFFLF